MLHSPPMYKAFRPDLQNPTREDAEVVFPVIQGMPIPYVEPEDISEAVLFLASDAARYVTGQQLRVDARRLPEDQAVVGSMSVYSSREGARG